MRRQNLQLIYVLVMLLLSTGASAQDPIRVVTGVITERDSTTPIPYASVYLDSTSIGTITNIDGKFILNGVPSGNQLMRIQYVGYNSQSMGINLKEKDTLKVNIALDESINLLESVVITGGQVGAQHVPGSAYYISPSQIQKFNYSDVNRILQTVPGVNIQEEEGFGLRPNIGLRGTGVERSSKITVMEDGVLMAPAPYSAPAAYYFPTIGRMQAIEVMMGSSQIKYGPQTTGGALNLISTSIPDKLSGRLHLSGGSFGSTNLHVYAGDAFSNFGYLVESYQYSSTGFKTIDGGWDSGFDKKDFLAKLKVNSDSSARVYQSLIVKIGSSAERSKETYLGLTQEDFDATPYRRYAASAMDNMIADQTQFSASHLIRIGKNIDVNTIVYRNQFERNWYKLDKVLDSTGSQFGLAELLDNPAISQQSYRILTGQSESMSHKLLMKANNRSYLAKGVQTSLNYKNGKKKLKHDFELGIRLHRDLVDRYQWVDDYIMDEGVMELIESGQKGSESNRIESASAVSAYFQYQIEYNNIKATPGIRFEHVLSERIDYGKNDPLRVGTNLNERSNRVIAFMPGVGVEYSLSNAVGIFAGIHRGFSPPGSNEETNPESSINYELGSRLLKNSVQAQVVGFYSDYRNLLGVDLAATTGVGTNQMFNGGKAMTAGIEFQIAYDLLGNNRTYSLPLQVAYTMTHARFLSSFESDFEGWGSVVDGDRLPYLASNQLSVILGFGNEKFRMDVNGRFTDRMRVSPGQGSWDDAEMIDSRVVFDANLGYKLSRKVKTYVSVTNLTNSIYRAAQRPAGLRPGMPRAVRAGIDVNF